MAYNVSENGFKLEVAPAKTTEYGMVKQASKVADSTATDVATLKANFNSLLTALKNAGIMSNT